LRVEIYFEQMRKVIETCAVVQTSSVTYDKRADHEGFISGDLRFVEGSVLDLREFVDVENVPERVMYVYQYRDAEGNVIFRYDNTGHHRKLNLPTYPHHKHDGEEGEVIPSDAPSLALVLEEIERLITLP
jgi:hypothetical protein